MYDGRDAAPGVRGTCLQARAAVAHDRYDSSRLRRDARLACFSNACCGAAAIARLKPRATHVMSLTPSSIPTLWRLARLDFDRVRQQHVLLYPEGAVLLNDTGAAILQLCDGQRSISTIAAILEDRYKCDEVAEVTGHQ